MSDLITEGLYPRSKRANPTIRRLALSILIQALRDVIDVGGSRSRGHCPPSQRQFWQEDALRWFSENQHYPGGLLWVCEILERDPQEVRAWVEEYKHADVEGRKELARRVGQLRKGGL